jgi:cytochrome c2
MCLTRRWLLTLALPVLGACGSAASSDAEREAEEGRLLLRQFGCGGCHTIPGVAAADGVIGPPLAGIRERVYLAGVLPNTPDNMVRWIRAPQEVDPPTAMPDLHVSEPHARAMVAYLYGLR